jgi:transposase-like protein
MMAVVLVQCPQCHGIYVVKYGKQASGTQRYRCNDPDCTRRIFLLQYHATGRLPAIKTGQMLAYVMGNRADHVLSVLQALMPPEQSLTSLQLFGKGVIPAFP